MTLRIMVFVFGLNRNELCKSLSSVYGDIDTNVYLRRFFDFEFNLPEVNSYGFARYLIDKFHIRQVFESLSEANRSAGHMHDYDNFMIVLPGLWSALGLSLRDVDYSIRLLALLARNVPVGTFTHPFLLAVLIAVKFKKPEFYGSLVAGNFRASEIMDYIDDTVGPELVDENVSSILDRIEGFLYCAETADLDGEASRERVLAELKNVQQGKSESSFQIISRRAQNSNQRQLERIIQAVVDGRRLYISKAVFGQLAELIDTYQSDLRR